jgi:long-chain acyl-CoA synthetase
VIAVVPSFSDRVAAWAARQPDAPAAIAGDRVLTYAELDRLAAVTADGLAAAGAGSGEVVAFIGRNGVVHPLLLTAASRAAAILASLSWRSTAAELDLILVDAAPRVIVVEAEFAAQVGEQPGCAVVVIDRDDVEAIVAWATAAAIATAPARSFTASAISDDAIVALTYTSGTTGGPKGVSISKAQLNAYLMRATPWSMWPGDVALIVSPVFHIAGWGWVGIALAAGACVLLVADPRPAAIVRAIQARRVTLTLMVPTLIESVLDEPGAGAALDTLRMVTYGAATITPDLIGRLQMLAPHADLAQGYGLSESTGTIAALGPADHRSGSTRLTSVGTALVGIELAVFDPDDDRQLADGELGEVRTRSEQNCTGYRNRPGETTRLYRDGWLRTGDLGSMDGGYLYLVDRLDDVINSGGEKVAPSEVERVIAQLPGVAEVCVVGPADPQWGQAVTAVVVRVPGAVVTEDEVVAACRAQLAGYKCPRRIVWADTLPHTPTGKLSRRQVRAEFDAAGPSAR